MKITDDKKEKQVCGAFSEDVRLSETRNTIFLVWNTL